MRNRLLATVGTTALVVVAVAALASAPAQAATPAPHPGLVPEAPAKGYPIIRESPMINTTLRRQVKATDQVGRAIVAGGDFLEVEKPDGTVVPHTYFAAWSIDTKALVCPGKFWFNGEILAVEPGPTPTTVYVGGRFSRASGADGIEVARAKAALLDLVSCSVDPTFAPAGANGKINDIVAVGNRLFVGGDFTAIGGRAIETVAELDAATGAVNPALAFATAGELADRVVGLAANPAGTRLYVGGRFGTMTGSGRSIPAPTAVIDITVPTAPVLTAHQSSGYAPIDDLQDVGVAPDGTAMALAYGTATNSDYVYLTPTVEGATGYRWRHYMRDSSFGIAVSSNAVYVAGHFCKPDAGPGSTDTMSAKMGFSSCTGSTKFSGGAWRSKLAALSLTDGTPLSWNPGQASWTGGRAVTVTSRGLLVGYDGERTNDVRTGALAMFDFGSSTEDHAGPGDVAITSPTEGGSVRNPMVIAGTASDDTAVASYRISVRNGDGRWLQADGTLGATYTELVAPAAIDGGFALPLAMPAGTYTAKAQAVDATGLRSVNWTSRSFTQTGIEGVAPTSTVVAPTQGVPTETAVTVSGVATDDVAVDALAVRVRDAQGRYLQPSGGLAPTAADLTTTVTAGALGSSAATWSTALGATLPVGTYTVEVLLTDGNGNTGSAAASFGVTNVISTSRPAVTGHSGFTTARSNSMVGSTFTVAAPTKVSAIGIFDANGNGVLDNAADTPAAIWVQSSKALVGEVTVARRAVSEGGWFYGGLITPVVLQPGTTYVVGHLAYSNGEAYASGGSLSMGPGVTYTGRASVSATKLVYPSSQSSGVGYGVANLRIVDERSTKPQPVITAPANDTALGAAVTLGAAAIDNAAVTALSLDLRDAAGRYLRADGAFGTAKVTLPVAVTGLGTTSAAATYTPGLLNGGTYTLTATATDAAGNTGTTAKVITVTAPATRTAMVASLTGPTVTRSASTVGATFTLSAATRVSALGVFDGNGNGVLDNASDTPVAIWSQATKALVAQANVPRGASSEGGWFYGTLVAPVTLQPGTTYVIGQLANATGEPYATGGTVSTRPGLTVTGRASVAGSTLAYPSTQATGVVYGLPNFKAVTETAPAVVPVTDRSDTIRTGLTLGVLGGDPDGGALAYAATGLPTGLAIDTVTGIVSGTPTVAGVFAVTVTVTDDEGRTATTAFTWTIPTPPAVTCTVAGQGADVLVSWVPVEGASGYQVLAGGKWVATPTAGVTSYLHVGGSVTNPYVVRYRLLGLTTDAACAVG